MRFIKALLLFFIAAAFAVFAVVNRKPVALDFAPLPYSVELPLFLLALLCFALGAAVMGLLMGVLSLGNRRGIKSAERRIAALENEIGGLKAERLPPALPERRDARFG